MRTARQFNDRKTVMQLVNLENKIQVDDNIDDIAQNLHRHSVMADMMLPGWYDGWESIYDNVATQFATINDNEHTMKELNVATDGDMAFVLMHIHLEHEHDGARRVFAFRQFDTFRRIGERWLVVLAHCMVPVEPDTGNRARGALQVRDGWKWPDDALPGPGTDEQQARQEVRAWFDARVAAASADAAMRLIGPREDVIVYTPYVPEEHRGQHEVRGYFASVFAGIAAIAADVTDCHISTNGVMASVLARVNYRVTKTDGAIERFALRQSHGLRRVGDAWQAMIEMSSFVADLATGKPVIAPADSRLR